MTKPIPDELKQIITNASYPLIFNNLLDWECLSWDLKDWNNRLGEDKLQFRCGRNFYTQEPQWERTTSIIKLTFEEFMNYQKNTPNEWLYFDYKYLREWLTNIQELKNNITWKNFGYADLKYEDSTIWIGSKGAHTPCHVDTYGCNLIAQVYGRKQWVLFPPEENLFPSRIPYEESSIYSKLNFFSPNPDWIKGLNNVRLVTLNPGEVLYLPHGWWHYVENLEIAISVNVWLPHELDDEKRVEEALVQFLMGQFVNNVDAEHRNIILNPNPENDSLHQTPVQTSINLISNCLEAAKRKNTSKKMKLEMHSRSMEPFDLEQLLQKFFTYIKKIPVLQHSEMDNWIEKQRKSKDSSLSTVNSTSDIHRIINAIVHPDVINLIKNKLL